MGTGGKPRHCPWSTKAMSAFPQKGQADEHSWEALHSQLLLSPTATRKPALNLSPALKKSPFTYILLLLSP